MSELIFSKTAQFLALSVKERFEAMRNLSSQNDQLIINISITAIVVLTLVLIAVSVVRKRREKSQSKELFNSYAEKRGLSRRECQMLRYMAILAGLQRPESIFTLKSAFDMGALKLIEEVSDKDKNLQIATEVSLLREKLAFKKKQTASIADLLKRRNLSTRRIPVGAELEIIARKGYETEEIKAEVLRNNDLELLIKLNEPVEDPKKTFLRGRYYYGASVWEFEIKVENCIEDNVVLKHSDEVKQINRRRFIRVPIERPGYIAAFNFRKDWQVTFGEDRLKESYKNMQEKDIERPEFYSAVYTEIAGPGFLLESKIDVKVGQRVLVLFGWEGKPVLEDEEEGISRIKYLTLQDIAEVKRVTKHDDKNEIAVEMFGVGDAEIDELIRITNTASILNSDKDKMKKAESVPV